jgi:demethylmenaquinone methyltransferase/2-methoxy-6-polyprenyl-1,4-benzoquinol methylase
MNTPQYDDGFVAAMFDRMGPTYDFVNRLSSFGFCEVWRHQCVRHAAIQPGAVVCDLMAGSGECWPYIFHRKAGRVIAVDFSPVMVKRQERRNATRKLPVEIRLENATGTSIASQSVDCVVGAFGLKTLSEASLAAFAQEICRMLKPGGRLSLLEISCADDWVLGPVYRWYVSHVIPLIGRLLLGDIECYRMLGVYTRAFSSCDRVARVFAQEGLQVEVRQHFFGCATALVGTKPGTPLESMDQTAGSPAR